MSSACSCVVMCPYVVSELVAEGQQAINISPFSTYVVNWSLLKLLFRTWPLNWQIRPAFLLVLDFALKKAKWIYRLKWFKLRNAFLKDAGSRRGSGSFGRVSRRKIFLHLVEDFWGISLTGISLFIHLHKTTELLLFTKQCLFSLTNVFKHLVSPCTVNGYAVCLQWPFETAETFLKRFKFWAWALAKIISKSMQPVLFHSYPPWPCILTPVRFLCGSFSYLVCLLMHPFCEVLGNSIVNSKWVLLAYQRDCLPPSQQSDLGHLIPSWAKSAVAACTGGINWPSLWRSNCLCLENYSKPNMLLLSPSDWAEAYDWKDYAILGY